MNLKRSTLMTVVALALAGTQVQAQAPAVAAGAAAPAAAGVAAPAAAPAGNIWSKICMTPEQKAACKQKICASPIIQLLGGALAPARAFSGGLLPPFCPPPGAANAADLKKPADSAEGATARIKQKEAEAKARRVAIRYLGTVDCRRYPEAEVALINGLRADENECVRLEAAMALNRGCCCTKKVLEALVACVSGRKTNEPAETSPRVRATAAWALEKCIACYAEEETPTASPEKAVPLPPPTPGEPEAAKVAMAVHRLTPDPLLEDARRVLTWHKRQATPTPQPTSEPALISVPADPIIQRTVAQMAVQQAEPVAKAVTPAQDLPRSGRRDMWSMWQHASR